MEKKMPTSATNEFGKHPCKEELNGVVGKNQQRKAQACSGLMENISKL